MSTRNKTAKTIKLNEPQKRFLASDAAHTYWISGIGGGKTFSLSIILFSALTGRNVGKFGLGNTRGCVCFLGAPTFGQVNKVTFAAIKKVWHNTFNFIENEHYVIDKKAPESWQVPKFAGGLQKGVVTTRFGSYLIVDGLFNYDKIRGFEFDVACIDEIRNVSEEAMDVVRGRMRGTKFKELGLKHRLYLVSSPPDDPTALIEKKEQAALNNADIAFIQGGTYDNADNLPAGYIETLEKSYTAELRARELGGELITLSVNPFMNAFKVNKHVSETAELPDYSNTVFLSFDFNISPCTCIAGFVAENGSSIQITHEFLTNDASIDVLCNLIKSTFPPSTYFLVTGDASGEQRSPASKNTVYTVIKSMLFESPLIAENSVIKPARNPSINDSRVLCNLFFEHHPNLKIHPRCKQLINDFLLVQADHTGMIDKSKDKRRSHLLDCFRYFINSFCKKVAF